MNHSLIEPGAKYFFRETLKRCRQTKYNYYNNLFNLVMFVLFILIIGAILVITYKNKQDTYGKRKKKEKQEEYLANVVRKIQSDKRRERGQMITNIPEFESIQHIQTKNFL